MTPWRRTLAVLAAVGATAGGAIALATDGTDPARPAPALVGGSTLRAPTPTVPPPPSGATPSGADRTRQRAVDGRLPVPLARAAARLFLVGFAGTTPGAPFFARLREREWGAVLVARTNVVDAAQLTALTGQLGRAARRAGHQAPLTTAAQLGGADVTLAGVGPPAQSTVPNAATARVEAQAGGGVLRRRGLDLVLAPAADLNIDGGPWQDRGFSENPTATGQLVRGAVDGWKRAGLAPVVGHFPGEGTASQDPELGVATVGLSRRELRAADEVPFAAVARTAPAIQMSGALYAGFDGVTPATLDGDVVRTLRATGFTGTVVSGSLPATTLATGQGVGAAAVAALKAGCDLLYVPGDQRDQEEAYRAVVRAVRDGVVPAARVREALARIDKLRARTMPR